MNHGKEDCFEQEHIQNALVINLQARVVIQSREIQLCLAILVHNF